MNPPTNGVRICATLVNELFTPSRVAVSFFVTLFDNLLVKMGLITPVA